LYKNIRISSAKNKTRVKTKREKRAEKRETAKLQGKVGARKKKKEWKVEGGRNNSPRSVEIKETTLRREVIQGRSVSSLLLGDGAR